MLQPATRSMPPDPAAEVELWIDEFDDIEQWMKRYIPENRRIIL
jgi:hypothetical protein